MKVRSTWDANKLLNHIEKLGENSDLSLRSLTHKLVALLMLLSASRVHCIHAFSTDALDMNDNQFVFYPTVLLKHSRPKFRGEPIVYKSFPQNSRLCVIHTLKEYISRRNLLVQTDALLVTYQKPHHPAHRDTVARWLKTILLEAGIKNFTAHTYRAASTSSAANSHLPISSILQQGQWTQESTWQKFYHKEIFVNKQTCDYAEQILVNRNIVEDEE